MKHLIVMFLLVALGACCPKRTDMLSSDVISEWLPYDTSSVIITQSNIMQKDTFRVSDMKREIVLASGECLSWKEDEITITLTNKDSIKSIISLTSRNINISLDSGEKGLLGGWYFIKDGSIVDSTEYIDEYSLNGAIYHSVLHISRNGSELFYAKEKGIIRYKINGIFWDIID